MDVFIPQGTWPKVINFTFVRYREKEKLMVIMYGNGLLFDGHRIMIKIVDKKEETRVVACEHPIILAKSYSNFKEAFICNGGGKCALQKKEEKIEVNEKLDNKEGVSVFISKSNMKWLNKSAIMYNLNFYLKVIW